MYIYLAFLILFIIVISLPYLVTQPEHFNSFMPTLETLDRHAQIEDTEQIRRKAARDAARDAAAAATTKPPTTTRNESQGEFRDRQLQDMFNKMQLSPGIDVPIPHDFFRAIPDEDQPHAKYSLT